MKKVFKSMFAVAAAALAFASCVKEEPFQNENDSEVEKVTIEINAEGADQTKTHMDVTNKVKWNKTGEALQVLEKSGSLVDATTKSYTVSDDLTTAKFSVELPSNKAALFDYWGIYPAANFVSNNNSDVANFKIELPDEQHPRADSFDADADLLISSPVHTTAQPTAEGLDFRFHRPVAVVEFTLVGIGKGEKITSVQFSNTTAALAGRSYYDLNTNKYVDVGYQGQDKKVINALYKDYLATGEDKVYITTFPASLKDFSLVVTTDKATYTKEVSSAAIELLAGHKKPLKIGSFTREELVIDQYDLLTDVSVLNDGDKLLITNGSANGIVKAMGPKVADKNRIGTVDVTVASQKITTVPADALIITLEGTTDNYLLSTANGYLSLNNTANELKYIASATEASKWKISVANEGNIDIISGTRPIRFNSTYFASYKATSSCDPVYVFYQNGQSRSILATPTNLNATVAEGTNVANVSWDAVDNADSYTVTCGDNVQTVNTNSATIADLAWSTTHTISVVANPASGSENFMSSAAVTTTVTTGKNPNEVILLAEGDYVVMYAAGTYYKGLTAAETKFNLQATDVSYDGQAQTATVRKNLIWHVKYNSQQAAYSFFNAATGKYLVMQSSGSHTNAKLGAEAFHELSAVEGVQNTFTIGAAQKLFYKDQYTEFTFDGTAPAGTDQLLIIPAIESVVPVKNYTLTVDVKNFKNINGGSGYKAYNGDHSFTVTSDDGTTTQTIVLHSTNVMVTSSKIQFKSNSGTIESMTDLNELISVDFIPSNTKLQLTNRSNGFTLKGGSSTPKVDSITIKFRM